MEEFYKQYAELDKDEVQAQEIVDMIRSSLIPGKDSLITYLNKGIDQGFTVMEKDSMFDLIRLWHNDQSIVEDISYLVQCSRSQSMLMSEMPEFIDSPGNSFHLSNMDNDSHIMFNQGLDRAKSPKPRKNSLSLNSPQRERFQKNRKFFTEAEDPNLSGSSAGSKIHDDPFRLDEFGSHDMILDTSKPSIMGTPLKQSMTINNSVFGSSPFKASELSPFRQKLDQESDNERTPIDLKSIVKENSNNGKQDFFSTVQQRSKIDPDVSNLISLSPMQPTSIDSAKLSSVESGSDYHESPTRVKSAVQRNSPLVSSSSRLPKLSKANPSPLRHNLEPLKELEPLTPISPITDEGLDSPAKHRRQIASLEETLKQFEDRVTELEQQNGILIMDNTSMRKQTVELKSKNSSLSTQKIELEMDIGKLKDEMIKEKNNGNSQYGQLNDMHNSLLNQAKSTEELNHDLTLQVKNLQEIIKDNEVKLNSKEQHITKMEVDQSAQQMQIENLEQLISVHADELSAKNKQLEISGSNFEALRLQFNEITASNDLLKKELDEAHMEIHRLQNLSNEFEKVKEFEIAMRPELKTAETQSDPIVFESEGGEPKEFLKLKATMPFIDSCETLNLQSQHRPLEIQNVQFVNIQPVQQPSRADEIFDVKAFDLSAVTNGNNSICFSTEPELFEEHVNRELMDKINALDEIVTKFEQENETLKVSLDNYQKETLQIRHEMSLGKQKEKEIERWFQSVRKTQATNNVDITKAKMDLDYEKRRQQRIYKKVQEFEAKQKRIVERKEAPVCVDPPAQNENIGPIHDKGEIQVIEKHIPDDMKEAVVVEEVIKTVVETTIVAEPIALAAEHIKKDDLVVEEDEVWNSESHNTAESPNQPKTGIEVKLEKQVTQRQSSSKVGYIIVLTIAITIAFSFIQPRFFKIILSLATEDDSFVVAI